MNAYRTSYGAAAMLIGLLAAGCAAPEIAPSYVGKVTDPGQDAAVAVVSDGLQVAVYVCGGPTTFETLSRWYKGDVDADGAFNLEKGDSQVTGDLRTGAGQITTDAGASLAFSVHPIGSDQEGLYSTMDGTCRTGAILGDLDGNGTVRLQGTWCQTLSPTVNRFAQVSPLTPTDPISTRGIGLKVLIDPGKSIFVDRVAAP
jgi:hypothetical protein